MRRSHVSILGLAVVLAVSAVPSSALAGPPVEQLTDLTGAVHAVVTLKSRDNFKNEFRYEVSIRNDTPDPLPIDSMILVLDHITDLAGKEASPRMEVVGNEGVTPDGRPYFKLPSSPGAQLAPYRQSDPAIVRLRNVAYTIVFTPSFRVFGERPQSPSEAMSDLVNALVKKGLLKDDELLSSKQHQSTSGGGAE